MVALTPAMFSLLSKTPVCLPPRGLFGQVWTQRSQKLIPPATSWAKTACEKWFWSTSTPLLTTWSLGKRLHRAAPSKCIWWEHQREVIASIAEHNCSTAFVLSVRWSVDLHEFYVHLQNVHLAKMFTWPLYFYPVIERILWACFQPCSFPHTLSANVFSFLAYLNLCSESKSNTKRNKSINFRALSHL